MTIEYGRANEGGQPSIALPESLRRQQEIQLEQEQEKQAPKRKPPMRDYLTDIAPIAETNTNERYEDKTVEEAAVAGFKDGLSGGPTSAKQLMSKFADAYEQHLSADELPSLAKVTLDAAESVEKGLSKADMDERMRRFPELRDVEVPTGHAARFPEFAAPAPSIGVPDAADIGDMGR